jgi:hypothetical protein
MIPEHHFLNIEYLLQGNERQKQAYEVLNEIRILEILREFNPILVGTIPIDIDIPESDLDIICEVLDFKEFEDLLKKYFEQMDGFSLSTRTVEEIPRIVCGFQYGQWMIEVFGQPIPTIEQNGFRHMVIENRILNILGSKSNEVLRGLKSTGLKTEPSFGKLLKLQENPYEALLQMYDWNDEQLIEYIMTNIEGL